MIPGVDFDQTFSATLRSSSLRLLGAIAAKLGLRLRRWDFTAAYLQGTLEEGESDLLQSPPGLRRERQRRRFAGLSGDQTTLWYGPSGSSMAKIFIPVDCWME